MNITKDKDYPVGAGQCDDCGGNGCVTCENKGWLKFGHPKIRTCCKDGCNNPIPPKQLAVYCTNKCAHDDA